MKRIYLSSLIDINLSQGLRASKCAHKISSTTAMLDVDRNIHIDKITLFSVQVHIATSVHRHIDKKIYCIVARLIDSAAPFEIFISSNSIWKMCAEY